MCGLMFLETRLQTGYMRLRRRRMMENSMVVPRICPFCNKEIEYDGTCGCEYHQEEEEENE